MTQSINRKEHYYLLQITKGKTRKKKLPGPKVYINSVREVKARRMARDGNRKG